MVTWVCFVPHLLCYFTCVNTIYYSKNVEDYMKCKDSWYTPLNGRTTCVRSQCQPSSLHSAYPCPASTVSCSFLWREGACALSHLTMKSVRAEVVFFNILFTAVS